MERPWIPQCSRVERRCQVDDHGGTLSVYLCGGRCEALASTPSSLPFHRHCCDFDTRFCSGHLRRMQDRADTDPRICQPPSSIPTVDLASSGTPLTSPPPPLAVVGRVVEQLGRLLGSQRQRRARAVRADDSEQSAHAPGRVSQQPHAQAVRPVRQGRHAEPNHNVRCALHRCTVLAVPCRPCCHRCMPTTKTYTH